jgi:cystathionine beta-lyase/cystathionine gamma-synthase
VSTRKVEPKVEPHAVAKGYSAPPPHPAEPGRRPAAAAPKATTPEAPAPQARRPVEPRTLQAGEPDWRFATLAIHAGQEPDPATGAVTVPIYQTSTYHQAELGKHKGYEYARTQNPTRRALESNLAALEGGRYGFAFGSGMAAIGAMANLLKAGDHVIASDDMYGGTFRLFNLVLRPYGLEFSYVDSSDVAALAAAIRPETRLIYVETPSNPLMKVTDLGAVGRLGKERGILTACDNTFMTPYFQKPLALGIDLVVHSTTKYLNGHSDMVGGVVVTDSTETAERLAFLQNAVGGVPGPFDCWLVLRGTKTLALRMERHNQNALQVARHLASHPKLGRIHYPGLPDHPGHELMQRQATGFGGMISFDLDSLERARRFLGAVRLFTLAESLGGVESLICHPASMTHASVPAAERARVGLGDGLVRLSVGIEDAEDLIADLDQALARL